MTTIRIGDAEPIHVAHVSYSMKSEPRDATFEPPASYEASFEMKIEPGALDDLLAAVGAPKAYGPNQRAMKLRGKRRRVWRAAPTVSAVLNVDETAKLRVVYGKVTVIKSDFGTYRVRVPRRVRRRP